MTLSFPDNKTKSSLRDELYRISTLILDKKSNPFELREASWNLFHLCSNITGIQEKSPIPDDINSILLQSGKAICPIDAAKCLQDYARTVMFMRGAYEGIKEAQKRFPGEKICVLYAGCGPFIPFVLGMTTQFSSDQVEFILIDIHQRSLDAAEKIAETFHIKNYIKEFVLGDAAKYKLPKNINVQVLLIETMNITLSKEPQVAITSNLDPQICKNGILIPEEITITACLADPHKEFKLYNQNEVIDSPELPENYRVRNNPKKIFELSLKKIPRIKKITVTKPEQLIKPTFVYKVNTPSSGNYTLMLCTKIKTFGDNFLNDYDSPLSMPFQINNLLTAGSSSFIEFSYWVGKEPGFKYRLIPEWKYSIKIMQMKLKTFFMKIKI